MVLFFLYIFPSLLEEVEGLAPNGPHLTLISHTYENSPLIKCNGDKSPYKVNPPPTLSFSNAQVIVEVKLEMTSLMLLLNINIAMHEINALGCLLNNNCILMNHEENYVS